MNKYIYALMLFWAAITTASECSQQLVTKELLGNQLAASSENMLQITVANQFSKPDYRADCGYHAPFNGMALAELAQANPERQKLLLRYLASLEDKGELIGKLASPWKQHILKRRAHALAGRRIVDLLLKSLQGAELSKEKPNEAIQYSCNDGSWIAFKEKSETESASVALLVDIIRNIGLELTKETSAQNNNTFVYSIPIHTIKEALHEAIKKEQLKFKSDRSKKEQTCDIALDNLDKLIASPDINFQITADTDWLEASDIKALWENRNLLPLFFKDTLEDVRLFTLADRIGANVPLGQDSIVDDEDFIQLQETLSRDDSNAQAIVVLYLKELASDNSSSHEAGWFSFITSLFSSTAPMQNTETLKSDAEVMAAETKASSDGHWVSMVVNKVGKDIQFLLANSGSNGNLLNEKRVLEAKALLLAKTPQYIQAQQQILTQAASPQTRLESAWPTIKIVLIVAVAAIIYFIIHKKQQDAAKKKGLPSAKAQPKKAATFSKPATPAKKLQ